MRIDIIRFSVMALVFAYAGGAMAAVSRTTELESWSYSGGAGVNTNHPGYTGTGFIDGFINNNTAVVSFNWYADYSGSYEIRLRYSAGNGTSSNTAFYLDGNLIKNLTCNGTGNWNTWADEVETVNVNAGNHSITYKAAFSSSQNINLDHVVETFKYSTTTEVETWSGSCSGGAKANNNHSGYTGTGFIDGFVNNNTATLNFNAYVQYTGTYQVTLRYSAGNGTSNNTGFYVDYSKIKNLTCNGTGNWNTWANEVETVYLGAGNHAFKYHAEASSQQCINLDNVTLTLISD